MRINQNTTVRAVAAPAIHTAGATKLFEPVARFKRLISCAMLGENQFYVDGADLMQQIASLSVQLPPHAVMLEAENARTNLGLRHTPLFLLCCLAARKDRGDIQTAVKDYTKEILRTPRDAMDLIALYFSGKRKPLPHFFKKAIAEKFNEWTPYQIAKYATLRNVAVRLRDVMFLTHPKAANDEQQALFKALADDTLQAPGTWESRISQALANKRAVWEDMLAKRQLGALALVRNLRNMNTVGVDPRMIRQAIAVTRATDVWPWQALSAAQQAPNFSDDLTDLMVRSTEKAPRIAGKTRILVDVSGSMNNSLSARGTMTRMDAATGLAAILREVCDDVEIASFSNEVKFLTDLPRGVRLAAAISGSQRHAGTQLGRAIGTAVKRGDTDRLIIITDEQSQDRITTEIPFPTYIINVASYQRGVDFGQHVTRINGWSGGVVNWLSQEITGELYSSTDNSETDDE
jgi:hypothetical protein